MDVDALIRERLRKLRGKHQDLEDLIDLIPEDLTITRELLEAVRSSDLNKVRRTLPLRVLLLESNLYPAASNIPITEGEIRRVASYLLATSKGRADHTFTETIDISKSIRKRFSTARRFGDALVGCCVKPYHEWRQGRPVFEMSPEDIDLTFLEPIYRARILTREVAQNFIEQGAGDYANKFYFATGVQPLDMRNILFFSSLILGAPKGEARLQHRIPIHVSNWFGIQRCRVPELLIARDLAYLSFHGLTAEQPEWVEQVKEFEDVDELMNSAHALLTPEKIALVEKDGRQVTGLIEQRGIYTTGLYFNVVRLAEKHYPQFREAYAAVDETKLFAHIMDHYAQLTDTGFQNRLYAAMRSNRGHFSGIGIRDLANILYFLEHVGPTEERPECLLPTVAQFRLGLTEREANGNGSPPKNTGGKRKEPVLPLLDEILQPASCYVLKPTFKGELPTNGRIFVPGAISRIYQDLPPQVYIQGPATLEWGQDPYEILLAELPEDTCVLE